ncbi:maleylpyruvate isomerase family mycothiol-dependent enzyme [Paractinoplanes toevensis]|uniref:Maleylpyruvate isomerase family mycothiol-dependent enzyme n=1 Tax=Paractinoplanes toevensis TaxID=571911 RepID=A0A919TAY2_9ACTN|nr:maleylpyruvate isomerase family mycothiol-dependent enzyme [Actinoplanes toevensis]GIM90899.1 hypothetical protein Ato02nite_026920 [Actinoplanes toevensis]
MTTLEFPDLLRLIDERSAAFRAAVADAPGLDVPVPTCPGWTLLDLVRHLGEGQRTWAATVAAGPASAKAVVESSPVAPEDLLAWSAESAEALLGTLRESGPDRGCWTWWEGSQSPSTSGAVARHRLQEVAVHTYDAQIAAGAPQPLPTEVALDGVDEFLATCCAGPYVWPHKPAVLDYHATEGRSWRLWLTADGVRVASPDPSPADASIRGTASDLVLVLYLRIPVDSLETTGDTHIFEQLIDWDPDE